MINLFKDSSGMAIIMVTTAVAILSFILADFTFETKLNKIRVENQVDRFQAKLNAEAGIKFALAKLLIYKEAWNTLEDNESLKKTISPSDAEKVVTQPFVYPIPLPKRANIIQKNAVAEFEKNNLLKGGLSVVMMPITGFLNPNNLKVVKDDDAEEDEDDRSSRDEDEDGTNLKPYQFMEKTFIETLQDVFKSKIESDEQFAFKYSNTNIEQLVKELKYYVNNPRDYNEPEKADIEKIYVEKDIKPKHAALESIDELYMLAGWDDELVNLLKDRMSVHQVSVINVNEMTLNQLKVLFPTMTPFQLEEFFKYRDGDTEQGTEPQPFKDSDGFRKYLTSELGAIETDKFDKRISEFSKAGINIGVAGKLFKVVSKGTFGRTSYQLTAFMDLPVKPQPPQTKKKTDTSKTDQDQDQDQEDQDEDEDDNQDQEKKEDDKSKQKTYLLTPRVIEIRNI